MKLPVIAIIGRPNVGKSTLFNALTKSRDALVFDFYGLTRDRKYGEAKFNFGEAIIIDTGGLSEKDSGIDGFMAEQSKLAVKESDIIFFMVDAKQGLLAEDFYIANLLRENNKEVILIVNKTDGLNKEIIANEFFELGFSNYQLISASNRVGLISLNDKLETLLKEKNLLNIEVEEDDIKEEKNKVIKFALVGKPNVGKSTLTNRILGEERVVVYDYAGTTIDTVKIPFSKNNVNYEIIDTAGIRRKGKVNEVLEKFSIVKTLQAIKDCDVAVIIIDAKDGLTEQDVSLVGFTLHYGKALTIAVNKWDGMKQETKDRIKENIKFRLNFVEDFIDIHFISALHGSNVGLLFKSIKKAYSSAYKKISTQDLTQALKMATTENNPPMSGRFRIKPKLAHLGGNCPPKIVIHGNQVEKLPLSYKRFLVKFFRDAFDLYGTSILLELKNNKNPFDGKEKSFKSKKVIVSKHNINKEKNFKKKTIRNIHSKK